MATAADMTVNVRQAPKTTRHRVPASSRPAPVKAARENPHRGKQRDG